MAKRLVLSAVGMGALVMASSYAEAAAAITDVSGTVTVNGTVAGKCSVQPRGGSTFTGAIDLGALDDPGGSGKINPALAASSSGSPAGSQTFSVLCNTSAPTVGISATAMKDSSNTPPTGYTNTVDYEAAAHFVLTSGSEEFGTPSGGSSTGNTLINPLSNTPDNVVIKVYGLNTDGGSNTSILTQGTYGTPGGVNGSGIISVTISP